MKNLKIIKVNERDAQFLQELMNNESVMAVLNEVPTTLNVWIDGNRILMRKIILSSMNLHQ